MNILVIGLGSMGKRRTRLLSRMEGVSVSGVDSSESRRKEASELFGIKTFESISEAVKEDSYDGAVVSTSPLSHASIIKGCLERGLHVFTEINLVTDGYDDNMKLAKELGLVLFLSSTPMYRKEMQFIKNYVSDWNKGNYRYHIGQYLPEWHPWENYKDFFVGDKRTNGCRELFGIELPWMIDAFGKVEEIQSIHCKVSDLSIPYDDSYTVIIRHSSGIIGNLSIDVVTPKAGRELEIWCEGKYLEWKGRPETLQEFNKNDKRLRRIELYREYDHDENYNEFVIEDAYYDEIDNFLRTIEGKEQPRHSFEKDAKILSLIDRIEE